MGEVALTSSFAKIVEISEKLAEAAPQYKKACFKRIIIPPAGFISPKYYSHMGLAHTLSSFLYFDPNDDFAQITKLVYWNWFKFDLPTYFVAHDFLSAVLATNPPDDYKLGQMHWPMPTMLFCLPVNLMLDYTGYFVPFLAVSFIEDGAHKLEDYIGLKGHGIIHNPHRRYVFHYPRIVNGYVVDYVGTFYPEQSISEVIKCDIFKDYYGELLGEKALERMYEQKYPTPEEDHQFSNKMCALALKLLMALNAVPEHIEMGSCSRPERVKKGVLQKAIWNPNIIGKKYVPAQATHEVDERRSPRMHWRVGHFHRYHCGPKGSTVKIHWLQPILVNKEINR